MSRYVLGLQEIDDSQVALVGGKGAHLGELSRIEGVCVPPGFCVTTDAFRPILEQTASIDERLDRLSRSSRDDRDAIRAISAEIRRGIEGVPVPGDLAAAIGDALATLGEQTACAVRSSATAEDLPAASFAGQQDTYLNVVGPAAILQHVRRCWASLFTERAVIYRLRNGVDHRKVQMAVVVQRMVFAQAAGVLFTADPVTSNRKVTSVEASFGLGEALVSGRVSPDVYKVRGGAIVGRTVAVKQIAVHASPAGGTIEQPIEPERQRRPALADAQVVRLEQLGRRIEAHFGCPQDIEWCLVDGDFQIVQSRPITTLYPIPEAGDRANHVYVSVGHPQMMTDAMKPLGLSLWQLTTRRPMQIAGGRLFVDVTRALSSPATREPLLDMFGKGDPLLLDALRTLVDRGDFVPSLAEQAPAGGSPGAGPAPIAGGSPGAGPAPIAGGSPGAGPAPIATDRAVVAELVARNRASVAALKRDIASKSGLALLDFILADIDELQRLLFDPQSHELIMTAIEAAWWLHEHLEAWLDERSAADTLTQSVPDNVTSEMGLALLDVADVIRLRPRVVEFLRTRGDDDGFLEPLAEIEGGPEARDAIRAYLDAYGMRCAGEIDVTRPRWSEQPTALVPMLLSHVRNFEAGEGARRFERGRQEASKKEHEVLARLRQLPGGEQKAQETKQRIDRVRAFMGYREYPKYGMISRYALYRQGLLREAERLLCAGVLREKEDIFFLTLPELREVVRSNRADHALVAQRRDAFKSYEALTPPRVLTSDGEVVTGSYRRGDAPPGALVGLPVSAGTVEGRARVVDDVAKADLESGDILVTAYTDPSFSPLFVGIAGIVTEVGGLMTHGAVIAREYGLPAVVGVEQATRRIREGQRIRVDGTRGYVEILD